MEQIDGTVRAATLTYVGEREGKPWFVLSTPSDQRVLTADDLAEGQDIQLVVEGHTVNMRLELRSDPYLRSGGKIDTGLIARRE